MSTKTVFYLVARSYSETSAGIRAMHLLCDRLNQLGQSAFLVPLDKRFVTNQGLNTPILSKEMRDKHVSAHLKICSIQDESIFCNALNTQICIRWLLNNVGLLGGRPSLSGNNNYVYATEIEPNLPRLFVNAVDYQFFENSVRVNNRDLRLFYAGKLRSQGVNLQLPTGALEIHREGSHKQTREELRELLTRAQVLYLAEDSSLALEAAICGCPTVHLGAYFSSAPLSMTDGGVGIAASDSPSDLQDAIPNEEDLRRYMATLELRTTLDVARLILKVQGIEIQNSFHKPRYRVSWIEKIHMRLGKLSAAYRKSNLKGIYGVLSSHWKQKKTR